MSMWGTEEWVTVGKWATKKPDPGCEWRFVEKGWVWCLWKAVQVNVQSRVVSSRSSNSSTDVLWNDDVYACWFYTNNKVMSSEVSVSMGSVTDKGKLHQRQCQFAIRWLLYHFLYFSEGEKLMVWPFLAFGLSGAQFSLLSNCVNTAPAMLGTHKCAPLRELWLMAV